MVTGGNGVLLGGQTEGVIAHGVQHVVALHPLHPGHDVRSRVTLGMARVQTHAGRVREHIQHIILGLGEIPDIRVEGVVFLPVLVPFSFNSSKIVVHCEHSFLKYRIIPR